MEPRTVSPMTKRARVVVGLFVSVLFCSVLFCSSILAILATSRKWRRRLGLWAGRWGGEQTRETKTCFIGRWAGWARRTFSQKDRPTARLVRAPRADETVFWVVGQARESCDQWDGVRGRERTNERTDKRTNKRTLRGRSGTSGRWSFKLKGKRRRARCHSVTGRGLPCRAAEQRRGAKNRAKQRTRMTCARDGRTRGRVRRGSFRAGALPAMRFRMFLMFIEGARHQPTRTRCCKTSSGRPLAPRRALPRLERDRVNDGRRRRGSV